MKTVYSALGAARRHLLYILNSPKMWAGALLIISAVLSNVLPYAERAWKIGGAVSIGILAYNFTYSYSLLKIYLAMLLIFSELPFSDPSQTTVIARSGKRGWYLSQIIYVFAVSIAITLIISLVSMILLTGHLSFENSWGRLISGSRSFSPYKAIAWGLPVGTLTMISFGSVILALNSLFRRSVRTLAGGIIIALTMIGKIIAVTGSRYFTLIEWSDFESVNLSRAEKVPTPEFEISVLSAMLIVSIIIILFCSRKKSEIKLNEVI